MGNCKKDKVSEKMKYISIVLMIGAGFIFTNLGNWDITNRINKLEQSLAEKEIMTEEVIGEKGNGFEEKFYLLPDGKTKAYIEIDGKPVENYFP